MDNIYFRNFNKSMLVLAIVFFAERSWSQPNLQYGGPYTFNIGVGISPLIPTNYGSALQPVVTTFAGNGSAALVNSNGNLSTASFSHPMGIAIDGSGNIYVADRSNNVIRKIITASNTVVTVAGSGVAGYANNTSGAAVRFNSPNSVAVDAIGNVYVADEGNQMIRKIDVNGLVTALAGNTQQGFTNSTNPNSATFNNPYGVAADAFGNVYVADLGNGAVRKITANGAVTTLASGFSTVLDVATDAAGNVYAADAGTQAIYKITPAGAVSTYASGFYHPAGLTVDASGNIFVGDQLNQMVRKIDPGRVVTTVAGNGGQGAQNGGTASATFNSPIGVAVDPTGNIFVADYGNNVIRKIAMGLVSISPALPVGLTLDPITGNITGTPAQLSSLTPYTITATNAYGTATSTVYIGVNTANGISISQDQNYILTYTPKIPISDIKQLASATVDQVNQTVAYIDGLGRPLQMVQWHGSPNRKDLVQPLVYDQFGRESTKYLPYANGPTVTDDGSYKPDAVARQHDFYDPNPAVSWDPSVVKTTYAASGTNYEPSPLNRPLEQGAPGQTWQLGAGHTLQTSYGANLPNEVINWTLNNNGNGADGTTFYAQNTLYKKTITDENGNSVAEFNDITGRIVCKKVLNGGNDLATYYVYDDLNNLIYVVPPIPSGVTYPVNFIENDPVFLAFIYGYHYDGSNRLVEKKIPGKAAWNSIVYNKLDQVIATQDPVQKNSDIWTFTKYDALGRVVLTGLYNDTYTDKSRVFLQGQIDAMTNPLWESRPSGSGRTNVCWPTNTLGNGLVAILTDNFYDDYTLPGLPYGPWNPGTLSNPRGLLTATRTTVLNPDGTFGPQLWMVPYYDDRGRTVLTSQQHYLGGVNNTANYNEAQISYNFDNSIAASTKWHLNGGNITLAYANAYYYDQVGRRTQNWQSMAIGTGSWSPGFLLSSSVYNELGQLKTKHLHSDDGGSTYLQNVNYTYNERGWLRTSGTSVGNLTTNLFNLDLRYDNPDPGLAPQFNGNIAEMLYSGQYSGSKQFNYTYDPLNRLRISHSTSGTLDENIGYDNLGNITALLRGGISPANLSYGYLDANNNYTSQLQAVSNNGLNYKSYTYDVNGNATDDGNINNTIAISHNMLDLPGTLTQGGSTLATYTYAANGNKLAKNTGSDGSWEYLDGIVYHNSSLAFVQTEEGKAVLNGTGFSYRYDLKDHLGNIRVTFDKNINSGQAEVVQEDEYYAFGMRHNLFMNANNNNYLFNGKERQTDLTDQYDYGARYYDATIGRWASIDPNAEKSFGASVYNYCVNNPVGNVDPDGRQWVWNSQNGKFRWDPSVSSPADITNSHEKFIGVNYLYQGDNGELTLLGNSANNFYVSTLLENQSLYKDFIFHREDYEAGDIVTNKDGQPIRGHIVHKPAMKKPERIDSKTLWTFGTMSDGIGTAAAGLGVEQTITGPAGALLGGIPALINILNGVGNDDDLVAVGFSLVATTTLINPAGLIFDTIVGVGSLINDVRTKPKEEKIELHPTTVTGGYVPDDKKEP